MDSPIITLTSDWTTQNHFVGKVKGRLYSLIPNVRVVDISHEVPIADKMSAAFIAKNTCCDFPEGSIHLIDVTGTRAMGDVVVVEADGRYYIMVDNGLPTLLFGTNYNRAVRLPDIKQPYDKGNFLAYDVFCPAAAAIAAGKPMEQIGTICEQLTPVSTYSYIVEENGMKVYIAYIDAYGNAYLGINIDEFERYRNGRDFTVVLRESKITLSQFDVPTVVSDVASQIELLLSVSVTGNLVISTTLPSGNVSQLFGLRKLQLVKIVFS